MHLEFVTETYPPEINGVSLTLKALVDSLRELGHDVGLTRPAQKGIEPEPYEVIVRGGRLPKYPSLQFGFPAGRLLTRRWQQRRPDGVYVATEGPLGFSAMRAAHRLGLPVLSGFHTRFDQYMDAYGLWFLRPMAQRYLRFAHRYTDATLVPTEELREELLKLDFPSVELLERGVDTEAFNPQHRSAELRAENGASEGDPVLLYVGRLAPEKNLGLLRRLFLALHAANPRAQLWIVGDGPSRGEFDGMPAAVHRFGLRRGLELSRLYASADLFVFPSLSETFGNVVLEALASGVPVCAYNYGAARQHVTHDRNGLLAPFDDEGSFILEFGRLAHEPALLGRLRSACRSAVAELSHRRVAEKLCELFLIYQRKKTA